MNVVSQILSDVGTDVELCILKYDQRVGVVLSKLESRITIG